MSFYMEALEEGLASVCKVECCAWREFGIHDLLPEMSCFTASHVARSPHMRRANAAGFLFNDLQEWDE